MALAPRIFLMFDFFMAIENLNNRQYSRYISVIQFVSHRIYCSQYAKTFWCSLPSISYIKIPFSNLSKIRVFHRLHEREEKSQYETQVIQQASSLWKIDSRRELYKIKTASPSSTGRERNCDLKAFAEMKERAKQKKLRRVRSL